MGLSFARKNSIPLEQEEKTLTNEKLRRAIERNRQKQLKRRPKSPLFKEDLVLRQLRHTSERPKVQTHQQTPPSPPSFHTKGLPSSNLRLRIREGPPPPLIQRAVPLGRQAEMNTSEFKKTLKTTQRKRKLKSIFLKAVWLFHGYLLIRLAVSKGGALEYYDKLAFLQSRHRHLEKIQEDNKLLIEEMNLIKNNKRYQKKLVRDNLGFIADNEYLVLFAQEKK